MFQLPIEMNTLLSYFCYSLLLLFVWYKIVLPYKLFFYYRSYGIPYSGFPLPLIGDMHNLIKVMASNDFGKSGNPFCEYYSRSFGGEK
jgi:hypothetical protein